MRSVEHIAYDDEDGFELTKRYMGREVGAWLARRKRAGEDFERHQAGERLIIDILIGGMPVPGSGGGGWRRKRSGSGWTSQKWLSDEIVFDWRSVDARNRKQNSDSITTSLTNFLLCLPFCFFGVFFVNRGLEAGVRNLQ